jgi:hypothetical protein
MPKKEMQSYETQLTEEADAISATLSKPTGRFISTKGKIFTLPDGTSNPGPLSVVILDYVSYNAKFTNVYDPNNIQPPGCYAINKIVSEMKPSKNAESPQAADCETCPHNQWGSAPTGKGKACKNQMRLLVTAPDATLETEPMLLTVSPTGLRPFEHFVKFIAAACSAPPIRVIADITFNPNEPYPTLQFSSGTEDSPALHGNLEVLMGLRTNNQELLHLEPEVQ